jgi:hypothetical protein
MRLLGIEIKRVKKAEQAVVASSVPLNNAMAGMMQGALMQGQMTAYNPNGDPFSPMPPLPPSTPFGSPPIAWGPEIGYNLIYSTSKKGGATFEQLRALAQNASGIRIVIDDLKRQLRALHWDIVPKDAKVVGDEAQPVIEAFRKPDGETFFSDWLGKVVEDIVVCGAMSLGKMINLSGARGGLIPVDAATIVPIVTSEGRYPTPPNPAFYQYLYGLPYREYTSDEFIYRPFNPRSYSPYGYSAVEACLQLAVLVLQRSSYYINWYAGSNLPPKFISAPEGWPDSKILAFQEFIDNLMAGNTAQKHKAMVVPTGSTVVDGREEVEWKYEFDEYLMRAFSWCVGVSPVWVTKTSSLGVGSEGMNMNAEAGVQVIQRFIEETLDEFIAVDLGRPDLSFEWVEEKAENRDIQLREDDTLLKAGVVTVNEVRAGRGMEPFSDPAAGRPMVLVQSGYVPLEAPAAPIIGSPFGGAPSPAPMAEAATSAALRADAEGAAIKAEVVQYRNWVRKASGKRAFTWNHLSPEEQAVAKAADGTPEEVAAAVVKARRKKGVARVTESPEVAALMPRGAALFHVALERMTKRYKEEMLKEVRRA